MPRHDLHPDPCPPKWGNAARPLTPKQVIRAVARAHLRAVLDEFDRDALIEAWQTEQDYQNMGGR